jgi:two-component system LytT family response regulator
MKLSAVIVDDEQNNIDNLSILLQQHCPEVEIIGTAMNASDGEQIILQQKPDLVFLDIQMPNLNGFDLLAKFKQPQFEVIFVTAFDKYGIQAVKFAALDYLLKPINISELKSAVDRAIIKCGNKQQNLQLENLMRLLKNSQQKEEHRIALSDAKETRFIKTTEIIRCESNNNYTIFYLANAEKITTSKPIFEYEEMLQDYGFIKCHQSHLVNKKYIRSWVKEDGGYLLLEDKSQIPVSRQKRDQIKQML